MKTNVEIDINSNFVIPLETNLGVSKLIIKQPTKIMMDSVAPLLSVIYSKVKSGVDPDIIVVDYELYLKEAGIEEVKVKAFIERLLMTAEYFDEETLEVKKVQESNLDETAIDNIEGLLLFFSALLRYGGRAVKKTVLKDFVTSLSALDLVDSYKKSSSATQEGLKAQQTQKEQ